jgi:hypothetical protein
VHRALTRTAIVSGASIIALSTIALPGSSVANAQVSPSSTTPAAIASRAVVAPTVVVARVLPTTSSTGWAASGISHLTVYKGPYTITKSGTVIDGKSINHALTIMANNVTIRRSRILAGNDFYAVRQSTKFRGLKLQYVEIGALPGKHPDRAFYGGTGVRLDHVNVHSTQRGIVITNGMSVTNSYFDGFSNSTSNHASAAGTLGGTRRVRLINNVFGCGTYNCSSALSVYPQNPYGGNSDWIIDSNQFNGGSYCVYLGNLPSERANTSIQFINNTFGVKYHANCGLYGPVASWSRATNTWSNNRWFAPRSSKHKVLVRYPTVPLIR